MIAALAFASAVLAVLGCATLIPPRPRRSSGTRGARAIRTLAAAGAALRRSTGVATPRSLEQRLAAAGAPTGLGVRELLAAKLAAAVVAGLLATTLAAGAPGRLGVLLLAVLPPAGFFVPD